MKFLPSIFIFIVITSIQTTNANETIGFEIPRTKVVDIQDPDSKRIYSLSIKLPRSYRTNNNKTYPVIYLTDTPYTFQIVSGSTRFPMNTGKMQEAIIVGISYSKGTGGHASRVRDYTHVEDSSWKYQTGNANQHINFINNSVFSYIEKYYKTSGSRTFVGNSLGGLLGAYILFTAPDMFNNYILGSPSVWYKESNILNTKTELNLAKHNVFIGVGANETLDLDSPQHDMVEGAQKLALKISKNDFPNTKVKVFIIPEANHHIAFPTTAIHGLYWLFNMP